MRTSRATGESMMPTGCIGDDGCEMHLFVKCDGSYTDDGEQCSCTPFNSDDCRQCRRDNPQLELVW